LNIRDLPNHVPFTTRCAVEKILKLITETENLLGEAEKNLDQIKALDFPEKVSKLDDLANRHDALARSLYDWKRMVVQKMASLAEAIGAREEFAGKYRKRIGYADFSFYCEGSSCVAHPESDPITEFMGLCKDVIAAAEQFLTVKPRALRTEIKQLSGLATMFEKLNEKKKK